MLYVTLIIRADSYLEQTLYALIEQSDIRGGYENKIKQVDVLPSKNQRLIKVNQLSI